MIHALPATVFVSVAQDREMAYVATACSVLFREKGSITNIYPPVCTSLKASWIESAGSAQSPKAGFASMESVSVTTPSLE